MIKFLLGFVAIIVVLLTAYMFSNKSPQTTIKKTSSKVEKQDVSKTEIEVSEVPEVKTSKRVLSVDKPLENIREKISEVSQEESSIGKGLTLESIENTDVSDEEKKRLLDDMVYHQSIHAKSSEPLSEEAILEIIEEDLKNGLIK